MITFYYGFSFAAGFAVIILLIVALSVIWDGLRDDGRLQKIERERQTGNHCFSVQSGEEKIMLKDFRCGVAGKYSVTARVAGLTWVLTQSHPGVA